MAADWEALLLAFLHDPPDKAVEVHGHVARACRYASAALGQSVGNDKLKSTADVLAAVAERFPAPNWDILTVRPVQRELLVKHPLSGVDRRLANCTLDENGVVREVETVLREVGDNRQWRTPGAVAIAGGTTGGLEALVRRPASRHAHPRSHHLAPPRHDHGNEGRGGNWAGSGPPVLFARPRADFHRHCPQRARSVVGQHDPVVADVSSDAAGDRSTRPHGNGLSPARGGSPSWTAGCANRAGSVVASTILTASCAGPHAFRIAFSP